MVAVSQFLAAQAQPVIQRIQIVKGKPWTEQFAAQELDLVLDLTLLPARGGRAGDGFDDIMVHQGQKAWMKDPILRSRDIGHHGFGVVDDHPARDPAEERQRPHKGIKHHLLLLVQIGHDERLATVAQAEMGHVNLVLDTAQQHIFLAPVELKRIARRKMAAE